MPEVARPPMSCVFTMATTRRHACGFTRRMMCDAAVALRWRIPHDDGLLVVVWFVSYGHSLVLFYILMKHTH